MCGRRKLLTRQVPVRAREELHVHEFTTLCGEEVVELFHTPRRHGLNLSLELQQPAEKRRLERYCSTAFPARPHLLH